MKRKTYSKPEISVLEIQVESLLLNESGGINGDGTDKLGTSDTGYEDLSGDDETSGNAAPAKSIWD